MFEQSLSYRLKQIFDLPKVSFDLPSEDQEQECLFIKIDAVTANIKEGRQCARVHGTVHVYCNSDKMPYGYFAKKLDQAKEKSVDFFFGPEKHVQTFVNISERSMDFVYLYDSQYNPNVGEITGITEEIIFQVGS